MQPLPRTVLVVDDHPDSQYIVSRLLEFAGYRVIQAQTGDEGAALARSVRPDAVIMDIAVPGIDGWAATRLIKADPRTRDVPVIALTALALPDDREKSLDAGCAEHLVKPVQPSVVIGVVRRLIGPARDDAPLPTFLQRIPPRDDERPNLR